MLWTNQADGVKEGSIYDNFPIYTHSFLYRPTAECRYPKETDPNCHIFHAVVVEIMKYNNIDINMIYRMCANCVHPTQTRLASPPHEDHPWPHTNLLIYLTDPFKGETVVEEKKFFGKEDDVIMFEGMLSEGMIEN